MVRTLVACVVLLGLTACAPTAEQDPAAAVPAPSAAEGSSGDEVCVVGQLNEEGVECQALQTLAGDVYTLSGDLEGNRAGALVCACGKPAEMSTCMQGTTLQLTRIGSPAICP
jgi:hypothetical protein